MGSSRDVGWSQSASAAVKRLIAFCLAPVRQAISLARPRHAALRQVPRSARFDIGNSPQRSCRRKADLTSRRPLRQSRSSIGELQRCGSARMIFQPERLSRILHRRIRRIQGGLLDQRIDVDEVRVLALQ